MATTLFLRTAASSAADYATANNDANLRGTASAWDSSNLTTTAGAVSANSTATATVAGPTVGLEILGNASNPIVWYSPPLASAATISGSITWNIWGFENSTSANVAINGRLEVIDTTTGTITLIDATARTTELGLSSAVNNFAETPAAGVACKKGDRLRVRIYGDDSTSNMATGFSFVIAMNGPTAAANGDSWIQLTETLSFAAEPAGTQIFPTEVASAVATAATGLEAWTTRGGGVQSAVTNTATGWTAPIQATGAAGGTVVDWWTRPLQAVTLGGAVRVNARVLTSGTGSFSSVRCEIAVTAGDGTGAVVWAKAGNGGQITASEAAQSFLISGNDLAVTAGQRLRIRFYFDDRTGFAMASGFTDTLVYAGAASATGDTFLTFTQTLTEYVPYVPRNAGINHQDPGFI